MLVIRLFVLFTVLLAATARVHFSEVVSYTFEKFVTDFNFLWKEGSEEWMTRRGYFLHELERIIAHNALNKPWKETVNKFSAMSPSERKAFTGRSKGASKQHKPKFDTSLPTDFIMRPVSELPSRVDWREAGIVSPVKDQGYCGSCWAFASTAVLESHVAKASGLLFDFSVEQIAFCAPNPESCGGTGGCYGSTAELAFTYLANSTGLYQEYQLGYSGYGGVQGACRTPVGSPKAGIKGYVQLPQNNYTALMNAVATVGPIAVSVDASAWSYSSGIFSGCNAVNPDIDHAVVLMGYGEEAGQKYWLVRNSWSPTWGEKGYIRIARSDDDDLNCGSDITPQDGYACSGDNEPIKVCGTCGILSDSSYPSGAYVL